MLDSPAYPCQLVLVTKLTAVSNAESGVRFANACGFSGRYCCSLWQA